MLMTTFRGREHEVRFAFVAAAADIQCLSQGFWALESQAWFLIVKHLLLSIISCCLSDDFTFSVF